MQWPITDLVPEEMQVPKLQRCGSLSAHDMDLLSRPHAAKKKAAMAWSAEAFSAGDEKSNWA
jgi:hypothetical protein